MKNKANTAQTRKKSALKIVKSEQISAKKTETRFAFVPIVREFRSHTQKNQARLWIPIETSLLVRYEFASCSLQTRYIFVAIVLFCGSNGIEEIPLDAKFMSSVLVTDERTIAKSFDELLSKNLLVEREKREKRKENTDRQDDNGVSVDSENFSEEDEAENERVFKKESATGKVSQFTIEECLTYVERCQAKGDQIKNAKALASHLFKTGEADSFILATLYPEKAKEAEAETYGEPILFSDEPCSVCYGARLADSDGKGYRPCVHCKNERGKSTGFEPKGENQ